nr:transposase [Brevundimonas subvibrioides]
MSPAWRCNASSRTAFSNRSSRILREQEAGVPVADLCRKHGLSSPTFYKWTTGSYGTG